MTQSQDPRATDTPTTLPARDVWSLLEELQAHNVTLSLRTSDGNVSGATLVLAIDLEHTMLMLDALRNPSRPIVAGDKVHLETTIGGQRVAFDCCIRDTVQFQEGMAYLAADPVLLVDEAHRRAAPRLQLPPAHLLEAAIAQRDMGKLPVQVIDISRMGFGAQIEAPTEMPDGMRVHCSLDLPDIKVFVSATVRHTHTEGSGVRVGLQFSEIAPVVQNELNRAVSELEHRLSLESSKSETKDKD